MGRTIRRDASVESIFEAVQTSLTNATAKGGTWKTLATERLGPIQALIQRVETELSQARNTALPLEATIDAVDDEADDLIRGISDRVWNTVGRPANDPYYNVLFPEGTTVYTEGDDEEQPVRMELLALLLESELHPKLPKTQSDEHARSLRTMTTKYEEALKAVRTPRAKVTLLDRTRTSLGRVAQVELVNLKRRFLADGASEADVHAVIPSVEVPKRAKKTKAPEPKP